MTAVLIAIVVVAVLVVLFLLFLLSSYRSLTGLAQRTDEAWRDLERLIGARAALMPRVVQGVEGSIPEERPALDALLAAGDETRRADDPEAASTAENHLQQALRTVLKAADTSPKVGSAPAFLSLRSELADNAEQIQASRRFYNGGVREFNAKIQVFPNAMFAKREGFAPRKFFEAADTAAVAEPPRVQF